MLGIVQNMLRLGAVHKMIEGKGGDMIQISLRNGVKNLLENGGGQKSKIPT